MSKNLFSCVKFLEKNTEKLFEEFASNWLVRFFINQTKINKHWTQRNTPQHKKKLKKEEKSNKNQGQLFDCPWEKF